MVRHSLPNDGPEGSVAKCTWLIRCYGLATGGGGGLPSVVPDVLPVELPLLLLLLLPPPPHPASVDNIAMTLAITTTSINRARSLRMRRAVAFSLRRPLVEIIRFSVQT